METATDASSGFLTDAFELASWNRPRSIAELRSFVASHEDTLDVEDFDF